MHDFQRVIGISCVADIDECAIGDKGGCHKDARCVNEVGSFRCECKPGYEGNGKTCIGISNFPFASGVPVPHDFRPPFAYDKELIPVSFQVVEEVFNLNSKASVL